MKKIFLPLLLVAGGYVAGNIFSCHVASDRRCDFDTVVIHDTVTVIRPEIRDSIVSHTVIRYLPMASTRTDTVVDTVLVEVPISVYRYTSELFDATVSGYEARIDSISIHQPVAITAKRPRRWNVSVTAGACLTPRGISPGVGIGVSYTLFSF